MNHFLRKPSHPVYNPHYYKGGSFWDQKCKPAILPVQKRQSKHKFLIPSSLFYSIQLKHGFHRKSPEPQMLVCWFLSVTEILPWMFHSRLKIHAPGESALLQWQAGSRGLILLYEVKEAFVTCILKIGGRKKTSPYLMMLFQKSKALMMIIIIINGTARQLTNNGEQMIPSWPQREKKSLYACRKLSRSFPGNFKLRWLRQSQLVVFFFFPSTES